MRGLANDQKHPDGVCHGRDLPDAGANTGVSESGIYGAKSSDFSRGYSDGSKIGSASKSQPAANNVIQKPE